MPVPLSRPPGPFGIPPFGVMSDFRKQPAEYLRSVSREYGDVSCFWLGFRRVFLLSRPDLIEEVLQNAGGAFAPAGAAPRPRVPLEGISPGCVVASAEQVSKHWRDGERIDLAVEMDRLAIVMLGWTLLDRDLESGAAAIDAAFASARRGFRWNLLTEPPFARKPGRVERELGKVMPEAAVPFFAGGVEKLAAALTWPWYHLARNAGVEERMRNELASVVGERPLQAHDVAHLQYTDQVFAESLRLSPPVWALVRRALRLLRLYNFEVPKNSLCIVSPYVMHRHPRFWADPDRFDPDRFAVDAVESRPRFIYFPFGGGGRPCPADPFGWNAGILVLAAIARRWRFHLEPGQPVTAEAASVLRPKLGLKVRLEQLRS